jgi:hypothetical protein
MTEQQKRETPELGTKPPADPMDIMRALGFAPDYERPRTATCRDYEARHGHELE